MPAHPRHPLLIKSKGWNVVSEKLNVEYTGRTLCGFPSTEKAECPRSKEIPMPVMPWTRIRMAEGVAN